MHHAPLTCRCCGRFAVRMFCGPCAALREVLRPRQDLTMECDRAARDAGRREQRIREVEAVLKSVVERARAGKGDWYVIFQPEPDHGTSADRPGVPGTAGAVSADVFVGGVAARGAHDGVAVNSAHSGRPGDGRRFVQFAVGRDHFSMDLPSSVLRPGEAERIVRAGSGFFRMSERPGGPDYSPRAVAENDPLIKLYISSGEERAAAEDAVMVLHDVWRLPPGGLLHVAVGSFRGEPISPPQ